VTGSSPSDLAAAFRSLHRRVVEALEPVGGDRSVAPDALARIDAIVVEASRILHTGESVEAVAKALDTRPASTFTPNIMGPLRNLALEAGSLLREVAHAAEARADGR
jgi:hypothetical protein